MGPQYMYKTRPRGVSLIEAEVEVPYPYHSGVPLTSLKVSTHGWRITTGKIMAYALYSYMNRIRVDSSMLLNSEDEHISFEHVKPSCWLSILV